MIMYSRRINGMGKQHKRASIDKIYKESKKRQILKHYSKKYLNDRVN